MIGIMICYHAYVVRPQATSRLHTVFNIAKSGLEMRLARGMYIGRLF